jgi:colanic acid biosynthesis glycosyl transferase WcaI
VASFGVSAAPLLRVTNIGRMPPRPALLVLNQYYAPGQESTAQLLADLCEALVEDYDVTVVTGTVHDAPRAERTSRNRVDVIRVGSTAFDRSRLALRGLNYVSFVVLALFAALRRPKPQVVLCLSDPPFVSVLGVVVARRHRVPLVVVTQDVFPEIAVALGRLDNPVIVGVLDRLIRYGLRHATRVVAIGEHMRRRLVAKGVREDRISVIPNWTDTEALRPRERKNAWAREHGLTDRFVVMHSGNVGYAQDLPTLLHAASQLRDLDDLVVVVVGSGAMGAKLAELATRLGLDNVRFLPYQPRERLAESLSSADVHVVGLAAGLAGYVVPSRLYGILAVGRPVIVHADEESETAELVRTQEAGVVVPPGEPELLAQAIRDAHSQREKLERMGRAARAYAEAEASRDVAIGRYRSLIDAVAARRVSG